MATSKHIFLNCLPYNIVEYRYTHETKPAKLQKFKKKIKLKFSESFQIKKKNKKKWMFKKIQMNNKKRQWFWNYFFDEDNVFF